MSSPSMFCTNDLLQRQEAYEGVGELIHSLEANINKVQVMASRSVTFILYLTWNMLFE